MSKLIKKDLIKILAFFDHLNDQKTTNYIKLLKDYPTATGQQVTSFSYCSRQYYAFIDNQADDKKDYIIKQLSKTIGSDCNYDLIINPREESIKTYAMPFKNKDCYLIQKLETPKMRLDLYLANKFPNKSRSIWQKYIGLGQIMVNNKPCRLTKYNVKDNDKVSLNLATENNNSNKVLSIIYLDDDIIVINKPAGVLSHSKGQFNQEFTVADFFKIYTTFNLNSNRPGIVHRLDRDTSGVMIGARHLKAATWLQKQFANRLITKKYIAITDGIPKNSQARIDLPISRDIANPKAFKVSSNGKIALTDYMILKAKNNKALIQLDLKTGRTHQIRVHLAYLGCPVLGDRIYGKEQDRLYLHAYNLTVSTPNAGQKTFKAPFPVEFEQYFDRVKL